MGLDNGIYLERNGQEIKMSDIGGSDIYYDVCYWRKFWEFRRITLAYLEDKYGEYYDGSEAVLDIADLKWFREQLYRWLKHPKLIEIMCEGYWTLDEIDYVEILNGEIKNLDIVIKLLEDDENGEYRACWYDSY